MTISRMMVTVARAAMFGRWRRVDRNSLRYSGANTMAKTVPHKIAPLSGHRIHANASDTATSSSRKLLDRDFEFVSIQRRVSDGAIYISTKTHVLDPRPSFRAAYWLFE